MCSRQWWVLMLGALFSMRVMAQIDVLDSISVSPGDTTSDVEIHFNIPVQYKSHAPATSGDVLRIEVEPVATLGAERDVLFSDQSIQWSASETVPLNEVVYHSSGFSTATVTLQFDRETQYEVIPSPDPRVLLIVIKHKAVATRAPARSPDGFPYAINLASSTDDLKSSEMPALDVLLAYRVYTTEYVKDGKTWNRLRVGFFRTKQEAEQVLAQLQPYYPGAWVANVNAQERSASESATVRATGSVAKPLSPGETITEPVVSAPVGSISAEDAEKIPALMQQANAMMTDKDYDGAIRLYTKIVSYPEHASSMDALEYLGLARERKGQKAQAKAVYDTYLAQYPESEGAQRVQQRLDGMLTAADEPRKKLASVGVSKKRPSSWDVFGGFSQFFRRDENTTQINDDAKETIVTQTAVSNDLDITGRLLKDNNDLRARFSGGYTYDILNKGADSESTISALYFDAQNKQRRMGMRLGRQSRSTGGVLGRFDGLLVEMPLTRVMSVAVNTGSPVNSSKDGFDSSRYFYGASLELEGFITGWDANVFYIEQLVDSITDRRATGGELRYFDPKHSFFTLVDYDLLYNDLNTVQLLGNWTTEGKTTYNLLLDYRNSPILTTTNALQGQTVLTIDELLNLYTEEQIYGLAADQTARSRLATIGATRPVSERLQVSGDVTLSRLSSTSLAAGTDNEFYYNLQLIGSNLIKEGDLTVLGMRYSDATTSSTTSLSLNTRYPVTTDFRLNPRMRIDFRRNLNDNTEQFIYRPSARVTWNLKRTFRLEAELGGEWSDRELVTGTSASTSYFVNLGYRADF